MKTIGIHKIQNGELFPEFLNTILQIISKEKESKIVNYILENKDVTFKDLEKDLDTEVDLKTLCDSGLVDHVFNKNGDLFYQVSNMGRDLVNTLLNFIKK